MKGRAGRAVKTKWNTRRRAEYINNAPLLKTCRTVGLRPDLRFTLMYTQCSVHWPSSADSSSAWESGVSAALAGGVVRTDAETRRSMAMYLHMMHVCVHVLQSVVYTCICRYVPSHTSPPPHIRDLRHQKMHTYAPT